MGWGSLAGGAHTRANPLGHTSGSHPGLPFPHLYPTADPASATLAGSGACKRWVCAVGNPPPVAPLASAVRRCPSPIGLIRSILVLRCQCKLHSTIRPVLSPQDGLQALATPGTHVVGSCRHQPSWQRPTTGLLKEWNGSPECQGVSCAMSLMQETCTAAALPLPVAWSVCRRSAAARRAPPPGAGNSRPDAPNALSIAPSSTMLARQAYRSLGACRSACAAAGWAGPSSDRLCSEPSTSGSRSAHSSSREKDVHSTSEWRAPNSPSPGSARARGAAGGSMCNPATRPGRFHVLSALRRRLLRPPPRSRAVRSQGRPGKLLRGSALIGHQGDAASSLRMRLHPAGARLCAAARRRRRRLPSSAPGLPPRRGTRRWCWWRTAR